MLTTSGFVDDNVFIPWGQWARINQYVIYIKEVDQVAVPVSRQTTTMFDRVHHNQNAVTIAWSCFV